MGDPLILAVVIVFIGVAVLTGVVASAVLARQSPERRRLREMTAAAGGGVSASALTLGPTQDVVVKRVSAFVPKSPKEMGRLQRRLTRAGFPHGRAAVYFAAAEIVLPIGLALATVAYMGVARGGFLALVMAGIGYTLPGLWLARKTRARQKQIENGLPDALDLLIVCVEAGAGLDAAIVKASEELALAYPYLAEELRMINIETRAGKPRLEAFRNFAQRTGVDDVRALVAMLVQTDRFGTSIAQALRTHAAVARTKRRQRAEERAAKLGVKLVFPLVFCLFPALYVVVLGPAVIKIMHSFLGE
ncbi:MAG: type II secretion system F family protein [Vicinamibacteria bacterium]|nr:type II secretion system F family protein [Vicinamibacteria bacterium]